MTRRRWLWITGIASVLLFAVLAALDARMVDEGGWSIVDFEFAGTREDAQRMVADWGAEGHDAARLSLWLDYLYMVAYGAFGALAVAAVRDLSRRRRWRRFAAFGGVAVAFPIAAASCDALENVGLLLALGGHGGDVAPAAGMAFAFAKFALSFAYFGYLIAGLVRAALERRRAVTIGALAVLSAIVVGVVAVGVSAQSETKAAEGQSVGLSGGDVHVEESGRPGDMALVLIHGYTGSTRWWERVESPLAREHRVINVDLLGHGRSEKPRDGYAIDEQARLVLELLRRERVRRAVVVGHSMGGWVGVSMAEQDPRTIRGVAVIGTAADRSEGPGPFLDRLGYLPVSGPAAWKAISDSYVRSELESAFADRVAVPDEFVDDTRALTWSAYAKSARESRDFREERAPYLRMTATGRPLLAILGTEDERAEAHTTEEWDLVPRGRVVRMRGVGHTPPWEAPQRTVAELDRFADPLQR